METPWISVDTSTGDSELDAASDHSDSDSIVYMDDDDEYEDTLW